MVLTLRGLHFAHDLALQSWEGGDRLVHAVSGALQQGVLHHIHLAQVVLHVGGDHLLRIVLTHLCASLQSCLMFG